MVDLPSPSQVMSPQERGCLWFDTSATCCAMGSFQSRTQRYKGNAVKASADLQSIHELNLLKSSKDCQVTNHESNATDLPVRACKNYIEYDEKYSK